MTSKAKSNPVVTLTMRDMDKYARAARTEAVRQLITSEGIEKCRKELIESFGERGESLDARLSEQIGWLVNKMVVQCAGLGAREVVNQVFKEKVASKATQRSPRERQ